MCDPWGQTSVETLVFKADHCPGRDVVDIIPYVGWDRQGCGGVVIPTSSPQSKSMQCLHSSEWTMASRCSQNPHFPLNRRSFSLENCCGSATVGVPPQWKLLRCVTLHRGALPWPSPSLLILLSPSLFARVTYLAAAVGDGVRTRGGEGIWCWERPAKGRVSLGWSGHDPVGVAFHIPSLQQASVSAPIWSEDC